MGSGAGREEDAGPAGQYLSSAGNGIDVNAFRGSMIKYILAGHSLNTEADLDEFFGHTQIAALILPGHGSEASLAAPQAPFRIVFDPSSEPPDSSRLSSSKDTPRGLAASDRRRESRQGAQHAHANAHRL